MSGGATVSRGSRRFLAACVCAVALSVVFNTAPAGAKWTPTQIKQKTACFALGEWRGELDAGATNSSVTSAVSWFRKVQSTLPSDAWNDLKHRKADKMIAWCQGKYPLDFKLGHGGGVARAEGE